MSARTPAAIASAAAEEIRALNHALYDPLTEPSDAYAMVGSLARLASMLPQALEMTGQAVRALETQGNLRSDRGTLPDDLADTYEGLDQAATHAHALYLELNATHGALGHIGLQCDGE